MREILFSGAWVDSTFVARVLVNKLQLLRVVLLTGLALGKVGATGSDAGLGVGEVCHHARLVGGDTVHRILHMNVCPGGGSPSDHEIRPFAGIEGRCRLSVIF